MNAVSHSARDLVEPAGGGLTWSRAARVPRTTHGKIAVMTGQPLRGGSTRSAPCVGRAGRAIPPLGVRPAGRTALLGAAAVAVAQAGPGVTGLGPVRRLAHRLAGRGAADHVALTFDDGPDPATTPRFLDVLASRGLHATFFLLGSMVAKAPGLAGDIAAAGHEVAVHGWHHRYLPLRTPWATWADLARTRDIVVSATGAVPRQFRPPYGVLSTAALAAARGLGLDPVLWTCWGREWVPGSTPESVYAVLAAGLAGGATVLLHDSDATSPPGSAGAALGALPMLLDECARHGLRVGTVAEHGIR
jgi:peptidoglycan-N-acetylglucosamine deacetylase